MAKLGDQDFKHYKDQISDDIKEHNKKLDEINAPDEVIAGYMGRFFDKTTNLYQENSMVENYLFISVNTILPSLFYQLPKIIIQPKRESVRFSAEVLTEVVNIDFNEKAKEENQLCIIDAFLPYGYAVMKNGYNSRTGKADTNIIKGTRGENKDSDIEGDVEYIKFEKSVGLRQSPKFTYLDSTQPFGKGNRISFEYKRTLKQLIDSNMYELSQNFINYFGARSPDKRDITLTVTEGWFTLGSAAWKLVYVDGWDEPIAWNKTRYDGLPVSYLRFNKMSDILYSVSHGALGLSAQKELNYLNELWKRHIDNMRNQHLIEESALTESGKKTLKTNDIGGIVYTNKPALSGIATPLQSAGMDANLFNNIMNVREYLKLVISTSGAKAGGPESDLATVERNKALGDVLRSSGMQDAIRDFVVSQVKQRIKNILRLGSPQMILKMTGKNLVNHLTGKAIEPNTELVIGGDTGLELKELINGDIETDFVFNVDITSAARPDYPVVRKQLAEGIALASNLEPKLREQGKKVNYEDMLEDYFSTFDAIPNARKYIEDMTEEEKAQMKMVADIKAKLASGAVPTEGAIEQGANAAPAGTEAL